MIQLCLATSGQNCEKNLIFRKHFHSQITLLILPLLKDDFFNNNTHSLFVRLSLLLCLQVMAPQNSF